ncbi:MAG TPA: tetratricopeptide repeat protein, partial [Chthoniobacterales bacterium]|nr:tetratricopeptide repeat protein [Chthoniobacterales bacterium]
MFADRTSSITRPLCATARNKHSLRAPVKSLKPVLAAADPTGHRVHSLSGRAARLRVQGRYREARPLLREALRLAEDFFGANSLEVASVLNQLGMLGKYDGHF